MEQGFYDSVFNAKYGKKEQKQHENARMMGWEYYGQQKYIEELLQTHRMFLIANDDHSGAAEIERITAPVPHPIFEDAVQNPPAGPKLAYAKKHGLLIF